VEFAGDTWTRSMTRASLATVRIAAWSMFSRTGSEEAEERSHRRVWVRDSG